VRIASLLPCAVLATVLLAGPSLAQDAAGPDPVYLEADTLAENTASRIYTARGSVRLVAGDRVILADELIYDVANARITARGSVQIFEGDEAPQTADELILDDALEEGVAYGFATLLENNGKAAAAAALRRPGGRVELRDAYYTACDLCEDGTGEPTWRLRAREVVRDTENDMIRYRGMTLEVGGVPVFYSPYFAHADPAARRKSGLLLPSIDISNRLGLSYQQPYFWAISPYQDLVIAPRLMSGANPLLELEWNRRFYSGEINVETSFTYEQEYRDPDPTDLIDEGDWTGDEEFRGHIFADGRFAMNPEWDWGFGIQAVYDLLYLRRYDYSEQPEETSALFEFDQRTLINQLYVTGRGEHYYTDLSTVRFVRLDEDANNDELPVVAPLLRFSADLPLPDVLGNLDFDVNAVNLTREDGDDYSRASLGFTWSRPAVLPGGIRAEAFALGRADAYHYTITDNFGVALDEQTLTRALGAAGLDVSWPFLRSGQAFDTILAPRLFTVAATGVDAADIPLPSETTAFDLDRSTLFRADRTGGYDIWEDGVRIDAGLSATVQGFGLLEPRLEAFAGRSVRLDGDPLLAAGPAVVQDESDWVADISGSVVFGKFGARTRIDSETGRLNRLDLDAALDLWRISVAATYTEIDDPAVARGLEEIQASAAFALTDRFSLTYHVLRDINLQQNQRVRAGFQYQDECTDLRVYWEREELRIGNLGPTESIKFEIVLFTLGGVGED
jgi:LPS-assembly protein